MSLFLLLQLVVGFSPWTWNKVSGIEVDQLPQDTLAVRYWVRFFPHEKSLQDGPHFKLFSLRIRVLGQFELLLPHELP